MVCPRIPVVVVVTPGLATYVGYVARTLPSARWRGYVGAAHIRVGEGTLTEVREAVERWAMALLGHRPGSTPGGPHCSLDRDPDPWPLRPRALTVRACCSASSGSGHVRARRRTAPYPQP